MCCSALQFVAGVSCDDDLDLRDYFNTQREITSIHCAILLQYTARDYLHCNNILDSGILLAALLHHAGRRTVFTGPWF